MIHWANEKDKFAVERRRMVKNQLKLRDIRDPAVLAVMSEIPREKFIPEEFLKEAYYDGPLSIGSGQTISQPYIVALMTQELKVDKNCDCLEIGTGSGYQTAILAKLARKVWTIERIEELTLKAQQTLRELKIENVEFFTGDGTCGWPENKIFDRIIITAATPKMPQPLVEQLKVGGFAVLPQGADYVQELIRIEKTGEGLKSKFICGCRFVKLIGEFGYDG